MLTSYQMAHCAWRNAQDSGRILNQGAVCLPHKRWGGLVRMQGEYARHVDGGVLLEAILLAW